MADDGHGAAGQGPGDAHFGADDEATRLIAPVGGATPSQGLEEATKELSPDAVPRPHQKAPPQRAAPDIRRAQNARQRRPPLWAYALTTVLVVAIVAGVTYAIVGPTARHAGGPNDLTGCGNGTPCQVADAYLAAFTGAKYSAIYALTSTASRTRFSDPTILHGAAKYQLNPVDYTSAQDYITRRTAGIVAQAQVYGMSATLGAVTKVSDTQVTFPARVIMHSTSLGDVAVDIKLPLRRENNAWWVDWSPGLIFPQLDDATDPHYTNLVRMSTQTGARGTIFSRDGQALALDETVYVVGVVPAKITNQTAVTQALVKSLDLTPAEITAAYQGKDANSFWPVRTITPMLDTQVSGTLNLAGLQIQQSSGRVYPFGTAMAPVTGYIGQVSPQDISGDTSHYYQSGDTIGRAGVEQWGEQYLRPTKGGSLVIRTRNGDGSDGPVVATIAERAAQNGEDVYTTIDVPAQKAAMASLAQQKGHSGGTVALAPATGDVLAMGSFPTYDPNDFSLGFTANEQARFNAMDSPYVNRATMAADPIGSVFKLVTLSAGLEHGISASQVFTCKGVFQVPGENHLRSEDEAGHGNLTAPQALGPSCNVVYWTISVTLNQKDPNILPTVAKQFGFGSPTGMIGLPADEDGAGIVPDPAWLLKNKNANWSPTDAANLGIGQGFFEASPAQVAVLSATLANNGQHMRPRLVTKVVNASGVTTTPFAPQQVSQAPLSPENLQIVQTAMLGPTYGATGTATVDFTNYPITVAGKTGTAESGQPNPHSWFASYAPASKLSGPPVTPQIAVGSLVEYSGSGEHFAVPVTKAVMSAYLSVSP